MDEYKKVIEKFFHNIEKLDLKCNLNNMNDRDLYLLNIIRECRNKLANVYNCIGDDNWELPDLGWQ